MKRLAYWFDFVVWPLAAIAIVAWQGLSALMLVGFALWTLAEYAIHRVFLHETAIGRHVHEAHHARPASFEDAELVPRTISSLLFTATFLWLVGVTYGAPIFAGIAFGYFLFICVHHGLHHWRISRWHPLYRCKMRHVAHHKIDDCNYGVITSVWDRLFRTEYRKRDGIAQSHP